MKPPRPLLIALVALCLLATSNGAPAPGRPIIGAIRWDAWVGDASPVGLAVEKTLSPRQWHYRLPFYAKELSADKVQVRGNTQEVMDREIGYAASAGLDYWAFVIYSPGDPMTRGGIDLYLSSTRKKDVNFCVILEGDRLAEMANDPLPDMERLINYFKDPGYQKVCGNRPLLFILQSGGMVSQSGFDSLKSASWTLNALRSNTIQSGLGSPFIVAMEWTPESGKKAMDQLGLDAVSSYASNGGGKGAPYADLATRTESEWNNYARKAPQVVPWVTTGWDRRPRVDNPVFWEKPGNDEAWYDRLQPAELTKQIQDAMRWNATHPSLAQANAIIIYAWNEFDEGGWLCPTLSEGDARLKAVKDALAK
jgi:hypothetical protein